MDLTVCSHKCGYGDRADECTFRKGCRGLSCLICTLSGDDAYATACSSNRICKSCLEVGIFYCNISISSPSLHTNFHAHPHTCVLPTTRNARSTRQAGRLTSVPPPPPPPPRPPPPRPPPPPPLADPPQAKKERA
jgi:hypothetical protein